MRAFLVLIAAVVTAVAGAQSLASFDGVTFSDTGSKLYFPLRELSKHLGWKLEGSAPRLKLNSHGVPGNAMRGMPDGSHLVETAWLAKAGAIVRSNVKQGLTTVKDARHPGTAFYVRLGKKRIFINKKEQMLVAYQGQRTVLRTRVSTGRKGKETPSGIFRARYKDKMHKSRLYHNVPMPWSINVVGNIFFHGFKTTPANASNGCIRLPLDGANPARWLYTWTEIGTPVTVLGKWPRGAKAR